MRGLSGMASTLRMTTLAVIIARAGSKGLRNKSMQTLDGKPLVAWTIEHALVCRRVDHVVLTTDGKDIAAVGQSYGIRVYERPANMAGDTVTIDAAARHGAACWEQEHDRAVDHVAIMYGNVCLRPDDLTDRALARLVESGADSVQSVYPVGKMHPLWMRTLRGDRGGDRGGDGDDADHDVLEMYQPNRIFRRQDLPPTYMLDGGAIAVRRSSLFRVDPKEPHAFLGDDRRAIVTQAGEVVDIDSDLDLCLAEAILARRVEGRRREERRSDEGLRDRRLETIACGLPSSTAERHGLLARQNRRPIHDPPSLRLFLRLFAPIESSVQHP